jgi:hypothetical protein
VRLLVQIKSGLANLQKREKVLHKRERLQNFFRKFLHLSRLAPYAREYTVPMSYCGAEQKKLDAVCEAAITEEEAHQSQLRQAPGFASGASRTLFATNLKL